jgi:hypothetical protein
MARRIISLSTLFWLALIWNVNLFAQAPDTAWTRTFGGELPDVGRSICFALDGGYIVAGGTKSFSNSESDIYLFKVDVDGNLVWQRNLGTDGYYFAWHVKPTTDRGYILAGKAYDEGFYGNVLLMKTDSLGYEIWRNTYDGIHGVSVIENSDGNFVVVGGYLGNLADCVMICVNREGERIWRQIYDIDLNEYAHDVIQTEDGGYVITGCTGAGDFDTSWDLFIMKTTSIGSVVWIKRYGKRELYFDDIGYTIKLTADRAYIFGATTTPFGDDNAEFWLVKTNRTGDTLWTKTYGGPLSDYGYCAIQTQDEGYAMAGKMRTTRGDLDVFVVKTDSEGDTMWTKTIGGYGNDIATQIIETKTGAYVVVGDSYVNSDRQKDAYVIKLEGPPTDIDDDDNEIIPAAFELFQNYPNPFNSATEIEFNLPESQYITLTVYGPTGREVAVLADGLIDAGMHKIHFDASELSSGIYFYRMKSKDQTETKRMIFVK